MAVITPENREEILQPLQTDFVANIPESDPFIRQSWLLALLIAIAGRDFDFYTQLNEVTKQMFPNTAEGIFGRQWGNLKGVDPNPAFSAQGFITVLGDDQTILTQGTQWSITSGIQYESQQENKIIDHTIRITILTRSGDIAEAITASDHNYGSGMSVTISGVDQTEYNGTFTITVTDINKFQYTVSGSPATPATGTDKLSDATFASVLVHAVDTGNDTNLGSGAQVTLVNPQAGVEATAYVQITQLRGGADTETEIEYLERYLFRYHFPHTPFNTANIITTAKTIPGVTRVDVFPVTPAIGDVTVYFLRDNDEHPIPDHIEIQDVKDALATIKPDNTPFSDTGGLIVRAPIAKDTNFVFATLTPNTETMREAIIANLQEFFLKTVVGESITAEQYRTAINLTVDPATGVTPVYTLSSPAGAIPLNNDEIALLILPIQFP